MKAKKSPSLCSHNYCRAEFSSKLRERRPPLRTFKELCEELGVSERTMSGALSRADAPKPVLNHSRSNRVHSNKWYDRAEFHRWWAAVTGGAS